jgi:transposase
MPPISAQTRIYLARSATNMRMSFRGLITLTEGILQKDPTSGHLFVFLNRRRDMIKVLYWDGSGFCIWYKRLERGSFEIPAVEVAEGIHDIQLSAAQLSLILEGIELRSVKQRLRFRRPSVDVSSREEESRI